MEEIKNQKELGANDKAEIIALLMHSEINNKILFKVLKKRLDKINKRSPGLLKDLLPSAKKGFRHNSGFIE